jgi:hypothetical protein
MQNRSKNSGWQVGFFPIWHLSGDAWSKDDASFLQKPSRRVGSAPNA